MKKNYSHYLISQDECKIKELMKELDTKPEFNLIKDVYFLFLVFMFLTLCTYSLEILNDNVFVFLATCIIVSILLFGYAIMTHKIYKLDQKKYLITLHQLFLESVTKFYNVKFQYIDNNKQIACISNGKVINKIDVKSSTSRKIYFLQSLTNELEELKN